MITAEVDLTGFERGMLGLINKCGLNSRTVVEKETGELIKTLVRVSPPSTPAKTRQNIDEMVFKKFESVEAATDYDSNETDIGSTGVKWYAWNQKFLFGVAPDSDMRKASTDVVRKIYYQIKKVSGRGRIVRQFRHPRKAQRVAILTKVLTTKPQLRQVAARIKRNIGRLKSAWLVAVANGAIKLTGSNQPPEYVRRHVSGARGKFENGLNKPGHPSFTIINFAKGIGQKAVNGLVRAAVNIRAKAMAENALLFMRGKKNLSDYA